MIYCSQRAPRERMVKHIVQIQADDDGSYFLGVQENKAKPLKKRMGDATQGRTTPPHGYFTAKVALRRNRKPRKTEAQDKAEDKD